MTIRAWQLVPAILSLFLGQSAFAIAFPNVKNLPQYSCKLQNATYGQFCSATRISSTLFLSAKHCAAGFTGTEVVSCPGLTETKAFRTSKFKVMATLPVDDLVLLQSEDSYVGAVPLLARTYEESEQIRKTGQCFAFGYGLGPTEKLGFQSRSERLQNDIHRGQGPLKFGFTISSGLRHWIGQSPLLEYNKSTGPGDSGGGLICKSPSGHEYLIGVHKRATQSFLPDRCTAVNVSYYNEWLFKVLN